MWLIPTKKEINKSFDKIKSHFSELVAQSLDNRILIEENKSNIVSRKEIELMIREAILNIKESTPRTKTRTPRTSLRKKAEKILNKVEIMQEIKSLINKGLSTNEVYNIIVLEKQLIKKTCFFKYIKIVREQTPRTPRTH